VLPSDDTAAMLFWALLALLVQPLDALVVRMLRYWLGGSRVKVNSRSPAS